MENQTLDPVEKEFIDAGVFFLEKNSIEDPSYEGRYCGVLVEIAVHGDRVVDVPEFGFSVVNKKRGTAILATDFNLGERDGKKILSFRASMRVPDGVPLPENSNYYMSFLDLCFYAGNEAIPEYYGEDITTPLPENGKPIDLGWVLSSRFIDTVIDALGKLDAKVLGGNMQNALLTGPLNKT
jgi:hypothetical protein